ncbi:hypothetical protein TFLX_05331 [Thermoflexales bacterium]|nr:hypothetical protein TFLX_05331 [Thermoflexales bacterium]
MTSRLLRLSFVSGMALITIGLALLIASPSVLGRPIVRERSIASPAPAVPVAAADGNLLDNPDFEDGYYFYPGHNSIRVPNSWSFAWYTDTPPFGNQSPFMQPEVSVLDCVWPNCNAVNYPPRINTGQHAVESGKRWANQDVSLYQSVGRVPIGALVSAEAWMSAWVSNCDPNVSPYPLALSLLSDNASGCQPGAWPVDSNHMLVGLDPYGGTDPRAATVVWNWDATNPPWWGPYDYYSATVPVVVVAHAHTVTLFLRGVTVQPAKFNTVYFDTASLTYSFPIAWQIDQAQEWPLSTAITIGLQTPVSLTEVSVLLQDPIGNPAPSDFLGTSGATPFTSSWQFTPTLAGTYHFTVTAHELPDSLAQTIAVQTLPFNYEQDHLLSSAVLSDSTLITYRLSSPLTLTNLSSIVSNPVGLPLTTTLVLSNFELGRYHYVWQFTAETSSWQTVTLSAAEFMQPFVQRVLVFTARLYLPIVLRGS